MLKRMLAVILSGVMILSTGCGLSSKTKNRFFGDEWVTYHMTWAINNGNSDYLGQLIKANNDNVDLLNDALTMALASTRTFKNRAYMVEQLLEAGADPNTKSSTGENVLITYLNNYKGCFDATAALLTSNQLDLSKKDDTGNNILYNAMATSHTYEYCSYKQVKMLVEAGAVPTKELFQKSNDSGEAYENLKYSPYSTKYLLDKLLSNGNESGLPLSLEYALLGDSDNAIIEIDKSDKNLDEDQKKLFVRFIMLWGTPEQFEKVLSMWNFDYMDYISYNSVAQTNNVDMFKYLIDKSNMDISERNYDNRTSLDNNEILDIFNYAAVMGSLDVCKYLCENDCVTAIDSRPRYLLLSNAIESQNFEVFKTVFAYLNNKDYLSEEEIDKAFDNVSNNRLYNESFSDYEHKVIDYLFENSFNLANIHILNLNYEGYKYITEKGRPVSNLDLFDAMDETDIEMFRFAVEKGADINSLNSSVLVNGLEISVISNAVQTGEEFVSTLIKKNVEIPKDIMNATTDVTNDTVRLLIDSGANVDIKFAKIPSSTKGDYRTGDFDLKDYWEAYGRDDLVELL